MKPLILAALVAICISCNSSNKDKPADASSGDTTISVTDPIDTSKQPDPPAGKIDIESFGELKLGQHYSEVIKVLGQPTSRSEATEWGADGLMHEDWNWKGISIGISYDKANPEKSKSVFSITATPPCAYKTRAGMGIGNSYAEVKEAYKRDIDPEATDKTQITVGSVYGGIIFSFENDKVNKIFLGAAAE